MKTHLIPARQKTGTTWKRNPSWQRRYSLFIYVLKNLMGKHGNLTIQETVKKERKWKKKEINKL
jgi:hypothetical protein